MTAERFASAPPLVKLAIDSGGNPNLVANHVSVCFSISFAAGDVRHGSVKRVASGVGEGSIAVQFTHQYLSEV